MGRSVTVGEIKTRALQRANMENSQFISPQEMTYLFNEAYSEFYDLMVATFQNYYASQYAFSTVAGQTDYTLPADFYKSISVESAVGTSRWMTVFPFDELEKNAVLTTNQQIPIVSCRLNYIPTPTYFTSDASTVDCGPGWETLLVTIMAISMLEKEESNTDALERRYAKDLKRIQDMAQNRDTLFPGRVADVTVYDSAYIRNALRYRVYGNYLQMISVEFRGF